MAIARLRSPFSATREQKAVPSRSGLRTNHITRPPPASRRHVLSHAATEPATSDSSIMLQLQPQQKLVKVCGVTNPEDAETAAAAGAHLIGMILWPKAKRSIPPSAAKQIAAVARRHGAEPVAVFVDESAEEIARVCKDSDVRIAQLHGDGARAALPHLPASLAAVYVLHAQPDGTVVTPLPSSSINSGSGIASSSGSGSVNCRPPCWVLVDSLQGGSGQAFDWQRLRLTAAEALGGASTHGWLLAGGLGPGNVAAAVAAAEPTGVDVSSGVCGPDGLKKDTDKVTTFVSAAREAFGLA